MRNKIRSCELYARASTVKARVEGVPHFHAPSTLRCSRSGPGAQARESLVALGVPDEAAVDALVRYGTLARAIEALGLDTLNRIDASEAVSPSQALSPSRA